MLSPILILAFILFSVQTVALAGVVSADENFFTVNPQQGLVVAENHNVTLNCDVQDPANVEFSWHIAYDDFSRADEPVVDSPRRYQKGKDLVIAHVRKASDSHWFYCKAVNILSGRGIVSTSTKLNITCKYQLPGKQHRKWKNRTGT